VHRLLFARERRAEKMQNAECRVQIVRTLGVAKCRGMARRGKRLSVERESVELVEKIVEHSSRGKFAVEASVAMGEEPGAHCEGNAA